MKTINDIQDEVIEEFSAFEEWMDKYQLLIDMGSALPPLAARDKSDDNLLEGCQSRVWLVCAHHHGTLTFAADSDALIVKGIIALLLRVVNGQTAAAILAADFYFIPAIGLAEHLSPTRANGLVAMVRQIRSFAAVIARRSSV